MVFGLLKAGYNKVKSALSRTGSLLAERIKELFKGKVDESTLSKLEQAFYEADLGVKTANELVEKLRLLLKEKGTLTQEEAIAEIRKELLLILRQQPSTMHQAPAGEATVILIVGVNGNGKTTSVAKLAKRYVEEGKSVLIAAADTYRAAATEQLELWATRVKAEIVKGKHKSDPSAIVFDAVTAGKARGKDIVLIDTAGRLHTKADLMHELGKIRRVCGKVNPNAPHETLLVLDATTGQNAIEQARIFHQHTPITGLILTKLDGTAKGGIVVAIQRQLGIPVKFVGVGESENDLIPFDAENFVTALFE